MAQITNEFIRALPKADLHCHLGGSIDIDLMIELAEQNKVELPSYTPFGLREKLFKSRYSSLEEYLECFKYTSAVTQSESNLYNTAARLAANAYEEGVKYLEVRFAPQLHTSGDFTDVMSAINAVNKGLAATTLLYNSTNPSELPYKYGVICIALRMFTRESSEYYRQFFDCHGYSTRREVYAMAALEAAKLAVTAKNRGIPVVGFDLAGAEKGHPAEHYRDAFNYAHRNFLKTTVHAGEAFGPESIFQAITDLHADRIGHGTHLLDPKAIQSPAIQDKEKYVQELSQYMADRRILIEICLTSNMMVKPEMTSIAQHPFKQFKDAGLSVAICTDNRTVCNTDMSKELMLAVEHFDLSPSELKQIVIAGFKKSFFPGSYTNKRDYVHRAIEVYEQTEFDHFGRISPRL